MLDRMNGQIRRGYILKGMHVGLCFCALAVRTKVILPTGLVSLIGFRVAQLPTAKFQQRTSDTINTVPIIAPFRSRRLNHSL